MVKYEEHVLSGIPYIHAYSDENKYIIKDGAEYGHYWFKKEHGYVFTEGEPIIESDDIDEAEAYDIIFGGGGE